MSDKIVLYDYYRSSCAYRVRIALEFKAIAYELMPVDLVHNGGEQFSEQYKKINQSQLVPTLVHGKFVLSQSMAIIQYLDELYPTKSLYPNDIKQRSLVRAFAQSIACDIHPLNNLRVLKYLQEEFHHTDDQKIEWYHHWLDKGFVALQSLIEGQRGRFCFGDDFTLADLVLIPQMYNAKRYQLPMDNYPDLDDIYNTCIALDFVDKASPDRSFKQGTQ